MELLHLTKKLLIAAVFAAACITAQAQGIFIYSSYMFTPQAGIPTFSPVAGTYTSTQTVTISTATSLAVICYTTDGTTPTEVSHLCSGGTTSTYTTPITVSTTQTVEAIATLATYTDSAVGSAAYTINSCVPPVTTVDTQFWNTSNYCTSGTTSCSNGLGIYQAMDASGNGNTATQATGANQPIYTTGAINGLAAAVFTAANTESMTWTSPISAYSQTEMSGFIVVKLASSGNYFAGNMAHNVNNEWYLPSLINRVYVNALGASDPHTYTAGTWYTLYWDWTFSGTWVSGYCSGGTCTQTGTGTTAVTPATTSVFSVIGASYGPVYSGSTIAEVALYDGPLNLTTLANWSSCKYAK